ncbi:ATP-binding protein [Ktedonobacteria bacterium brp13]|nr:ATP-binding protein [Ktedonobacteria bacterium brp13]
MTMTESERWLQESLALSPTEQRSLRERSQLEVPFSSFVPTKEYRRFVQVCEACRRYRYMVVCVGERGVGKTLAAREYAQWDVFEPLLSAHGVAFAAESPIPRTAFYTPRATATPKGIEQDLALLLWGLQMIAEHASTVAQETSAMPVVIRPDVVDVLIVDEVDGLSQASLEVLRDIFDRSRLGLVLLGRSGSAARLQKMAALASRVGVLHAFGALGKQDTRKLLEQQVQRLCLPMEDEAVEVFVQKTQGNFQMMYLVLCHLDYLLVRRGVFTVTKEVVEEAIDRLLTQRNVQRLRGTS